MECTVSTGSSIEQTGARDRMMSRRQFKDLGQKPNRYYIFAKTTQVHQLASVVGMDQ